MTLRTGGDTLIWRKRLWIALYGGIVLEEALDLSSDRILNEWMNEWIHFLQPIPVAARSKAWVCGRSFAGSSGCNPAGGMNASLLWVLCCQVEIYASGRPLVQNIPAECGVSECNRKASTTRVPRLTGVVAPWEKNNFLLLINHRLNSACVRFFFSKNPSASSRPMSGHLCYLTLRLLISYILVYGAPSKATNANVVYIWTYVWQRWNSLFLFAAQCFKTESMRGGFLCHICV